MVNVGATGAREASPWFEPDGYSMTWSDLYAAALAVGATDTPASAWRAPAPVNRRQPRPEPGRTSRTASGVRVRALRTPLSTENTFAPHGDTGPGLHNCHGAPSSPTCPSSGRPPFGQLRDLTRTVHADCAVVVDTNAYSVPWRLIGERVVVSGGRVCVHHGPRVVAEHVEHEGRHARVTDRAHLVGVVGGPRPPEAATARPKPELLRPLDEYAAVAGGSF